MTNFSELLECLDSHPDSKHECRGPVEWHTIEPGVSKAFPRCERHWDLRLDQRQDSMEMYANSDVAPSWFDPSFAGEHWDEDY